jgi:hypothetical protein
VHRDDQIGIVERNHHSHPLAFDFQDSVVGLAYLDPR